MKTKPQRLIILIGALPLILIVVLLWLYGWSQQALSADEVDRYVERIAAQSQNPGGRHDLPELRRFLESDDGRPFYTVNLYEFHQRARYRTTQPRPVSGQEAFARFSAVMLRLLAKRGSHPIFGSDWADSASSGWDRIVVVRYRSRRDIAEVFATRAFAEASAHKWAALKRNDRMLVQGLHIPELLIPSTLVALVWAAWAFAFWRLESRRRLLGSEQMSRA